MLINLPEDAQLITGTNSTSFHVFLNIRQNILQFVFAKVMGKMIALCCLTIIYLISGNYISLFLFFKFFFTTGLVTYLKGLLWGIKLIHVKDCQFYAWSWLFSVWWL